MDLGSVDVAVAVAVVVANVVDSGLSSSFSATTTTSFKLEIVSFSTLTNSAPDLCASVSVSVSMSMSVGLTCCISASSNGCCVTWISASFRAF